MNTLQKESSGIHDWIWDTIHDFKGRAGKSYAFGMIIVISLAIALIPLQFYSDYVRYAYIIEHFILGVAILLTTDLVLQFLTAPSKFAYLRSSDFMWNFLALLPFYIEGEIRFLHKIELSDAYLHLLHMLRILLLFELTRIHSNLLKDRAELRAAFSVASNEEIMMIVSKHFIFLLIGVISSIVILSFGIGIMTFLGYQVLGGIVIVVSFTLSCIVLYRTWQDYTNDGIVLTSKRIIISDSAWWEIKHSFATYSVVTAVVSRQSGIFGWLFGFGSISMEWRGGQYRISLARQTHKAAEIIRQQISESNTL